MKIDIRERRDDSGLFFQAYVEHDGDEHIGKWRMLRGDALLDAERFVKQLDAQADGKQYIQYMPD